MKMWRNLILLPVLLSLLACTSEPVREANTEKAAELNADLGLRYMMQGKNELAMQKLRRALEYNSDSVEAHHYIAELYRRVERPDDADRHFRIALDLTPEDSALRNNYGIFLCSQKRYDDAEEQLLKVLEDPVYDGRAGTYENLGLCMQKKPDLEKAESYFRQGLKLDPRMPKSLLAMAEFSFKQRNYISTRAFLQRYSAVARHTPHSLWLRIQAERVLGDKDAVASHGMLLKNNFPDSPEARKYLESERR